MVKITVLNLVPHPRHRVFSANKGPHSCKQSIEGNREGSVCFCSYCLEKNEPYTDITVVGTLERDPDDKKRRNPRNEDDGKTCVSTFSTASATMDETDPRK